MKIVKIILIIVLAIVIIIGVAAIIFIKTFDINRYKPQIKGQLTGALHRTVDFEKASVAFSLERGIDLKINNLMISDDPAFNDGTFLTVKEAALGIDVMQYLRTKEFRVPTVLIDSPELSVIRKKDGSLNVQTIGKQQEKDEKAKKEPAGTAAAVAKPAALPALLISSFKIKNGTVKYTDQSYEPAMAVAVSQVSLQVDRISLMQSFPFVLEAAVLSAAPNIRIEGKVQVDLKSGGVTLSDVRGSTELSNLILEKIPATFPMAKGIQLPSSVQGKVDVAVAKVAAGPKGLSAITADTLLSHGMVQVKALPVAVKNIDLRVKADDKKIIIEKGTASLGQGAVQVTGTVENYLAQQDYALEAGVKELNLKEVLLQDASPVKVEGVVAGSLKVKGKSFNPEAVKSGLSGQGDIAVTKAKLKDLNILRTVLDKLSMIPGLTQKIEEKLPERYKEKLAQKDTTLSDMALPVVIENGRLTVKDAVITADEFAFKGMVQGGFDGSYTMEGAFLIPQELSAFMVADVSELQYLLNEDKQIYIPLKVAGKGSDVKFSVDIKYLTQKLLVEQGRQQLFKVLDKALGIKESSPEAAQPGASETQGQQPGTETEDTSSTPAEAVGAILENILK